MMRKSIKQELTYQRLSKNILIFTAVLSALFAVTFVLSFLSVKSTDEDFRRQITYYEENNLNIQEDLNGAYKVTSQSESSTLVENPLAYEKMLLEQKIYAASSDYAVPQALEASMAFSPFLFVLLGGLVATFDYKYKTIKIKTVQTNRFKVNISKQVSLAIMAFIILALSLIFAYICGHILELIVKSSVDASLLSPIRLIPKSGLWIKMLYGYLLALFYAEIGYLCGVVFQTPIVGFLAIVARGVVIPSLGAYDPLNIRYFFADKIFDFVGVTTITPPKEIIAVWGAVILAAMMLAAVLINMVIARKRSSFV